ncbi:hypothetical protein [Calidifontibacillus oryziterrae]|uniref:hypothetical protein n=1 Tax=Calidifontibacillus oryziterrae TaxID=1191699 RepID=UPI00031F91A2|nr:hypothetical protein [Calidifontibacillus oryziterrae]
MYYSKQQLEKIKKQGEEAAKEMDRNKLGHEYKANDMKVICMHCKHDKFEYGKALLNTRGMTFFDIEWLNGAAITLVCKQCGFIHWFGKDVTQIEE